MRTPASSPVAQEPGPTDFLTGLSTGQVEARRQQYGPNEVLEKKPHALLTFLSKFWGLSAWMLEAIAALSWALHRYADLVIAAALLALNAVIAFVQERRAEGVVDTLRRRLQVNARVLREGHWQTLPARELVPGDITRIRQGDVVQLARPTLHAEALVAYLVRWLFVIVGVVVMIIVGLAIARGIPLVDVLPLLLALLLGAVPVALPVMLTVSMAVGARELSASGVLVTRLSATEDAAAMNVLCVDKTGTITANHLAVARVIPLPGFSEGEVRHAAYASEAANQDPIDLAIRAHVDHQQSQPHDPEVGLCRDRVSGRLGRVTWHQFPRAFIAAERSPGARFGIGGAARI